MRARLNRIVAKTALRRKKALEHQLEQTSAQMMTLEREISSIETANINKETLEAMKNAAKAMKQIHGPMNVETVDQIMEDLREQHAVGEEIAEAISGNALGNAVDEDELDEELAELQQEELDNKMLKTGTVPVSDAIHRLPNQPVGPSKWCIDSHGSANNLQSKGSRSKKRTTKRQSCKGYKQRWLCDNGRFDEMLISDEVYTTSSFEWLIVLDQSSLSDAITA